MSTEITKEGSGVADATPTPQQSVTQPVTTPAPTPSDVVPVAELEKLRALVAQREEDLNKQKSVLQKNADKQKKDYEARLREQEDKLRRFQISALPEAERQKAMEQEKLQETETWKQRAEELRQQLEEVQTRDNYIEYFKEQGVPVDKLKGVETTEDLLNVGWASVMEELKQLREKVKAVPPTQPVTQPALTPPPVATTSQGLPKSGPNWGDLEKKYGSRENVYQLVESGDLPTSIIPLKG